MAEILNIVQFCFAVSEVRGEDGLLFEDGSNAFSNMY